MSVTKNDKPAMESIEPGTVVHDAGFLQDFTELKRAEEALAESERLVTTMMDNLPGMVYRCRNDRHWTLEFASQGIADLTGYPLADFLNRRINWGDIVHPEDEETVWNSVQYAVKNQQSFRIEYRILKAGGNVCWVWEQGRGVFDDEGQLLALEGFITDITQQKNAEQLIKKSEEKYRSVIETTREWIWEINVERQYTYVSPMREEILGYTADEMLRKDPCEFMLDEYKDKVQKDWPETIREKRGWNNLVLLWRHKDGSTRYLESSAMPILDEQGELTGFRGTDRDVTERVLSREKLEFTQFAIDHCADAAYWVRSDGRLIYVNDAACNTLGYTREELLQMSVYDVDPSLTEENRDIIWRQVIQQRNYSGESSHKRKDGTTFPVSIVSTLLNFKGEDYACSFVRDITERKQAEDALRKNEEKFRGLLESTPDGFVVVDDDGCIRIVNAQLELMTGYNRHELIGKPVEILVPERIAGHRQLRENYVLNPSMRRIGTGKEFSVRRRDGSEFPAEITLNPLMTEEGLIISTVIRDITRRKRAEDEIMQSHKRLRNLAASLYNAREVERTRISREIHDELGQILTGLKMDFSFLYDRIPKNDKNLPERLRSMIELVDSAIDFVRKLSSSLRPAMLDDLGLEAAIEWQLQGFSKRTGCNFTLELTHQELGASAELESEIFRIFQESLTNIARHAGATRVDVSLHKDDSMLILKIKDNGMGIHEDQITSNNSIGLIGMCERAAMFGGDIQFDRLKEGGTQVTLSLPLGREAK